MKPKSPHFPHQRFLSQKPVTLDDLELTEEFVSAFRLMEETGEHLFVTGKAGTGKSTLLRYFREKTGKKIAVLAPTGVAAVNVTGQTIHSFFRFPPTFLQPEDIRRAGRMKRVIEQLDTLVVDEVSMVRADVMDAIDYAMRLNRKRPKEAFGGAQLVVFGDLLQLPPVLNRELQRVFQEKYESPYFFSARVFQESPLRQVELTRIFRQTDTAFVELLNRVRNGQCGDDDLRALNARVWDGELSLDAVEGRIVLTTTNRDAAALNEARLESLPGRVHTYTAQVGGTFEESAYPNDRALRLKEGAQVMLLRNDTGKRWVNGTIGRVERLSPEAVTVSVDGRPYEVGMETWEKIRYDYDPETEKIDQETIGTFQQYPLKLAWAITIHKSQGQTFEKVMIDLGRGAFASGQLYVALSRCTTLNGVQLTRPVEARDVICDERLAGMGVGA